MNNVPMTDTERFEAEAKEAADLMMAIHSVVTTAMSYADDIAQLVEVKDIEDTTASVLDALWQDADTSAKTIQTYARQVTALAVLVESALLEPYAAKNTGNKSRVDAAKAHLKTAQMFLADAKAALLMAQSVAKRKPAKPTPAVMPFPITYVEPEFWNEGTAAQRETALREMLSEGPIVSHSKFIPGSPAFTKTWPTVLEAERSIRKLFEEGRAAGSFDRGES